ncbi:uncharacterized protein FTOL_13133 [Fusarium torulosum]|uniref:Heterokaryon incompatibility domain-containing protein n=1 Tax=Fusarium torulosum TaxID=33205 RepID=A0AAE8MLJ5_9HYPO|nr:uncharacterized protein FTOL_13133 [Fusarium torulosum]
MIQCNLTSVSCRNPPAYVALSYCWGDGSLRQTVIVNGHQVSITESLATALRYMRNDKTSALVWADAICINQYDRDEKSVQVAMMGDIYAQASLVWIWLGEPAGNSDLAMDFIRKALGLDFTNPSYSLDPVVWSAVKALLKRPWWGRLWVIQEALLSKKAILNCGSKSADLECLVHLKELQTQYLLAPLEQRLEPIRSSLVSPFGLLLLRWKDIRISIAKGQATLKELIDMTGEAKCFLLVDKIYGIMSMCNAQDRRHIPIDYKCCAACVVLRVGKYIFRKYEMFGPLAVLQTHQVVKNDALPSWAPDYAKYDYESHFVFPASNDCKPFRAAADNAAWFSLGLPKFPDMSWFFQNTVPTDQLEVVAKHPQLGWPCYRK